MRKKKKPIHEETLHLKFAVEINPELPTPKSFQILVRIVVTGNFRTQVLEYGRHKVLDSALIFLRLIEQKLRWALLSKEASKKYASQGRIKRYIQPVLEGV